MALTVKKITLWRSELENRAGALARTLGPLAAAGTDLQVLMGYTYPGNPAKAAVELYPVSGKKGAAAAQAAGLAVAAVPTLLVSGDNRVGLGAASCRALADAGINLSFLVTQVVGRKYSAVYGFESEADASRAIPLLRKAVKKR